MYTEMIRNPVTGETLYVLESTPEVFRVEFAIEPGASMAAEHFHPNQEQSIRVTQGALGVSSGGKNAILHEGDTVVIPPGEPHFEWNPTRENSWAIEEIRPAGKAHAFYRVAFALARDGATDSRGVPSPLIAAAMMDEFGSFARPTSARLRVLFKFLKPISKLLGYGKLIRAYIKQTEIEGGRHPIVVQAPFNFANFEERRLRA
jgi:quercetin dioxygenase-like cupin family protein